MPNTKERLNASVDPDEAQWLRRVAVHTGLSVSALVQYAIRRLRHEGHLSLPAEHPEGEQLAYKEGAE